jgi:hypothetical protein
VPAPRRLALFLREAPRYARARLRETIRPG